MTTKGTESVIGRGIDTENGTEIDTATGIERTGDETHTETIASVHVLALVKDGHPPLDPLRQQKQLHLRMKKSKQRGQT